MPKYRFTPKLGALTSAKNLRKIQSQNHLKQADSLQRRGTRKPLLWRIEYTERGTRCRKICLARNAIKSSSISRSRTRSHGKPSTALQPGTELAARKAYRARRTARYEAAKLLVDDPANRENQCW